MLHLLLHIEGERLDLLLGDGEVECAVLMVEVRVGSLCLLSPGGVEVVTCLSSALSLLLIISVL